MTKLNLETLAGEFASDLLRGADAIAEFLFGSGRHRRKVYHLAETSRLPVFRLGAVLCARRSVLLQWVAQQEQRNWSPPANAVPLGGELKRRGAR